MDKSRSRYERWQIEKLYVNERNISDSKNLIKKEMISSKRCGAPIDSKNSSRNVSKTRNISNTRKVSTSSNISTTRTKNNNNNIKKIQPELRKEKSAFELRGPHDLCYFIFDDNKKLQNATLIINCTQRGLKV